MTLAQKINDINDFCEDAFGVVKYVEWEFAPFRGPLSATEKYYNDHGHITASSFTDLINKVYDKMLELKKEVKK